MAYEVIIVSRPLVLKSVITDTAIKIVTVYTVPCNDVRGLFSLIYVLHQR